MKDRGDGREGDNSMSSVYVYEYVCLSVCVRVCVYKAVLLRSYRLVYAGVRVRVYVCVRAQCCACVHACARATDPPQPPFVKGPLLAVSCK